MTTSLNENLPEVLKSVRTQPLFVMRLDVRKLLMVGATPGAYRRVPGGAFEGERLSGGCLPKHYVYLVTIFFLVASASLARAHHRDAANTALAGISIPSLMHNQMGVIANNMTAILDLANRQIRADPHLRRLQTFINLQFFACVWGIVPGSLDDENSPFNECSHAYLAATWALLIHLQAVSDDHAAVEALARKVEREMLDNGASLFVCRYSDEPFNTAEIIGPHWSEIPGHVPSAAVFLGLPLAIMGCGWMAALRRYKRTQDECST
jgi:hypothetical protein